jgi:hypothetical protein
MSKLLHTSKLLHIEVFLALALVSLPSAFPLDLLGFGGYPFPVGRRRESMSFLDPLEGTETGLIKAETAHAATPATVWVQVMDSCRQALPGAKFQLVTPNGTSPTIKTSSGTKRVTVSSGGSCPLQRGNCEEVHTGCLSWTITPPSSGTKLYKIKEKPTFNKSDGFLENPPGTMSFTGYVPCNGGSACRSETATFSIDSSGVIAGRTTNILPDGQTATYPSEGQSRGTPTDPIVFHNFKLGNVSCDGDKDSDDHLTGSPSSHCDNDNDK